MALCGIVSKAFVKSSWTITTPPCVLLCQELVHQVHIDEAPPMEMNTFWRGDNTTAPRTRLSTRSQKTRDTSDDIVMGL